MLFNERRQKINLCKITADLTSFYVLSSAACLLWSGRPCRGQCHFHMGSGTAINNFEPRILIHNCGIFHSHLNSEYWFTIVIFCSHFEQRLLIHKRDSIDISSWTASANSQAWFCSHFEPRLLIHKREFTAILNSDYQFTSVILQPDQVEPRLLIH